MYSNDIFKNILLVYIASNFSKVKAELNTGSELIIQSDKKLSEFTSIELGGKAKYFISCSNPGEIIDSYKFAESKNLPVQILAGGSNVIFPDEGFEGLVIKIDLKGIEFYEEENIVFADIKAGEVWDDFVMSCIERDLTGLECLSGIPGFAGATPIQNVGAYGQEISESLVSLKAIDRSSLEEIIFENKDCDFGYRQSRFKGRDKDKYIITEVRFRFEKNKDPLIKYAELQKSINSANNYKSAESIRDKLNIIRSKILELRRSKSMLE